MPPAWLGSIVWGVGHCPQIKNLIYTGYPWWYTWVRESAQLHSSPEPCKPGVLGKARACSGPGLGQARAQAGPGPSPGLWPGPSSTPGPGLVSSSGPGAGPVTAPAWPRRTEPRPLIRSEQGHLPISMMVFLDMIYCGALGIYVRYTLPWCYHLMHVRYTWMSVTYTRWLFLELICLGYTWI